MQKFFTYVGKCLKFTPFVPYLVSLLVMLCANKVHAQNLITNGCFENGGEGTGFDVSGYTVGPSVNAQHTIYVNTGSTNSTSDNSTYSNCPDHTTGTTSGNALVVQGANFDASGDKIYEAYPTGGIPVTSGVTYTFTYWIETLGNTTNPANITVTLGGSSQTLTSGSATAPTTTCSWQKVTYTVVANSSTLKIWMFNTTTTQSAFALDDISLTAPFTVTAVGSNPVCPQGTGSITATASGGFATPSVANSCGTTALSYTYSDGGAYQSSPTFSGLAAGTYTIKAEDGIGDMATASSVTITIPANPLSVSSNATISCSQTASLLASGGSGTYAWSPSTGLSSTTIANPTASVIANSGSTLYTVTSTTPIANPIVNGSFSSGNTGFSTSYNYDNPNSGGAQRAYDVTTAPDLFESAANYWSACGAETGSGNMMMVLDGATASPQVAAWSETVPVEPSSTYTFTYWVQSVSGSSSGSAQISPASLQTSFNGSTTGITGANPVEAPLTSVCGNWMQVTQTWSTGTNTSVTIAITDMNTVAVGNDFALDNISFTTSAVCTVTDTVRVFYGGSNPTIALSSALGTNNQMLCSGNTITPIAYTIGGGATGASITWSPSTPIGIDTLTSGAYIYNITGTPTSSANYQYTVTTSGGVCSTVAATGSLDVYANNTWLGVTNFHWNVPTNWTCGVPAYNSIVTIPNVTPYPQPILDSNVTISNIADYSGATLGLNGYTFTIDGIASGTGTISDSSTASSLFGSLSFGPSATGAVYFTPAKDTIQNLTLAGGANVSIGNASYIASTGVVTVGTVTTNTGATLATGGPGGLMTLVSDNNGSARIAAVPVNGSGVSLSTIGDSVAVQCYIHSTQSHNSNNGIVSAAHRAWRLLTAPITDSGMGGASTTIYSSWQNNGTYAPGVGTMITVPTSLYGSNSPGLDEGINGNYSMYYWNQASQALNTITDTKAPISASTGRAADSGYLIFVRGDRTPNTVNLPWYATVNNTTLSATGFLQLGNQTFSSGSSLNYNGLMLVGNPYACSVNFKKLAGDTATFAKGLTNLVNRYYVWNSNTVGSQGVGGYMCIDDAINSGTYLDYTNSKAGAFLAAASFEDLNIQSGQAFFLQDSVAGVCSITFTEAAKTSTNNFIYRPQEDQDQSSGPAPIDMVVATLSLLNSDSTTSLTDGVVAQFKNGFCDCVDYADAPKFSNIDEMFSLARHGKQLAIERRPEIVRTDTLFLNLKQMAQRAYQFGFTLRLPNHPGLGARLEDHYLGTKQPLNMDGSDSSNFTLDGNAASQDTGRFIIVFGAVNIAPVYTTIKAIQQANTVLVQWTVSNDSSMTGYILQRSTDGINYVDVDSTIALHTTGAYSWVDTNPAAGANYYRVISTDVLNEQSYSAVVSVTIPLLNPGGITVFPNPIQNGQIGLAFNTMPAGNYSYCLYDEIGQLLQEGAINHSGGNATYTIPLQHFITKGNYQLKIIKADSTATEISLIY